MAHPYSAVLALTSGLTLTASVVDTTGAALGSQPVYSIVALGDGFYLYTTSAMPDGTRGVVLILDGATVVGVAVVEPRETEYADASLTSRTLAAASYATVANQTTILNRLGAWTGADLNTLLGAFRALLRKDSGLTPSDIGGTFDNTTDSLEAIRDRGDSAWGGGGGGGSSVFTLSQVAAPVAAALPDTGNLSRRRGDTWSIQLTGLGPLTGRTKLWWTVKAADTDLDTAALIQIEETAGLVRLAGSAGTSNQGSLTVDDADAGDVSLVLLAVATAQLPPARTYRYDVQIQDGPGIRTLAEGRLEVTADITRTTS